jgi:hypothetical protein
MAKGQTNKTEMTEGQANKTRGCAGCTDSDTAIKRRIAKRAAVLGAELQSEPPPADQNLANLLSATRVLMAECALANSWDKEEAASYARVLDFAEVALELASSSMPPGTAETKASECGDAKRVCVENCHQQDGYWCFVDCRFEYFTCLASTIWTRKG